MPITTRNGVNAELNSGKGVPPAWEVPACFSGLYLVVPGRRTVL